MPWLFMNHQLLALWLYTFVNITHKRKLFPWELNCQMNKFHILSPRSNLIIKDTNIVQFHEEVKWGYMEFPNAKHFATGITIRHKLLVAEFHEKFNEVKVMLKFIRLDLSVFHIITSFIHINSFLLAKSFKILVM